MVTLAINIAAFIFVVVVGGYFLMLLLTGIFYLCMWVGDFERWANAKLNAWADRTFKRKA